MSKTYHTVWYDSTRPLRAARAGVARRGLGRRLDLVDLVVLFRCRRSALVDPHAVGLGFGADANAGERDVLVAMASQPRGCAA